MGSKIQKIEYYLPDNILDNHQLEKEFPDWAADKIEEKVGISQRHCAGENETAMDLAFAAGEKVLENYDKGKIDFLLLCTQSPDYFLPTTACLLQDKFGLKTSCGAFDYNLGCSGYIYGLAMAKSFIASGIAENILLITSETYTKHINKLDKGNRTIFGDGAAATIIEKTDTENILEFVLGTDGRGKDNLIIPNGGMRSKYNLQEEIIDDNSGSLRTNNDLYMNGPEIFNFTISSIPKLITECLTKNNTDLEKIDYVIFHQANKYMLDYLRKKIKCPDNKFYNNMLQTGNTVSATIPIALKNSLDRAVVKSGDKVLLVGFGVGYSWGATVIEI